MFFGCVGFLGLAVATVVGVLIGLARISSNLVLNVIGTVYVEIFRNLPLILQAFLNCSAPQMP